eukprot:COSAG02_NODE_877_length_16272_cov_8.002288_7_plen_97_part_00
MQSSRCFCPLKQLSNYYSENRHSHLTPLAVAMLSCRDDHPFFVCTQFHPEFNSGPGRPSPPFVGLLLAAAQKLEVMCPPDSDTCSDALAALLETAL